MDASIFVLFGVAVALVAVAVWTGGPSQALEGISKGGELFAGIAPQLILGFVLAGLVTVLLPSSVLSGFVGADSGIGGLMIASIAGIATPGGPFVQFPLVAALDRAGAGPGPMAAYLTAWSLMGWNRIVVYELPLLGPHFTMARFGVSLAVPMLVGLVVPHALRLLSR